MNNNTMPFTFYKQQKTTANLSNNEQFRMTKKVFRQHYITIMKCSNCGWKREVNDEKTSNVAKRVHDKRCGVV